MKTKSGNPRRDGVGDSRGKPIPNESYADQCIASYLEQEMSSSQQVYARSYRR